jgi:hypothetical protein
MQHTRQPEYALLLIALLLLSPICFFPKPAKAQAEAATIKIINPLSGDNKFIFNSTDHPVNSTFTLDFYVVNVTKMCGWQIFVEWNNTIINFQNGWIPDDNVFAVAVDAGATIIHSQPSLDMEINDIYSIKYGASLFPVTAALDLDLPSQAILCKLNFTIVVAPENNSQIFTNIALIGQAGGVGTSLDSYVQVPYTYAGQTFIKNVIIFAEPAIVRVLGVGSAFQAITDVAITSLKVASPKNEVGDSITIEIVIQNIGNDLEMINVTIGENQKPLAKFRQVLGAYANVTYTYTWNSSGVPLDIPVKVAIFGIPIVIAYQARLLFSADLAVAGDMNQTNNHAEVILTLGTNLTGLDYWRWLILIWLSSPIGQLLLGYTIIFATFLATLSLHRRLRSPKPPRLPKTQEAKKPDTASK